MTDIITDTKIDLDKDFKASADKLVELRAGRNLEDIPLADEYWLALHKHQIAYSRNK